MRNRRRVILAVCAACCLGASVPAVAQPTPSGEPVLAVTFSDRPSVAQATRRLAGLGAVKPAVPEVGIWELRPRNAQQAIQRARTRRGVLRVETVGRHRTDDVVNADAPVYAPAPAPTVPVPEDPLFVDTTRQWGLHNGLWSIDLAAYSRPPVAVLDTGVDATHEEWRGSSALMFARSTFQRRDGADDWANDGHGTHITGILGAPVNGVGIVGVAPVSGPGVAPGTIIPVQIADREGYSDDFTMMRGIRWAVNHGAKVINISSSGPDYNQAFQDTINWAYRRGALVVASVGNSGDISNDVNYPAAYDHVIGVGAQCDGVVDPPDCPVAFGTAAWSQRGPAVDLVAPGVEIVSSQPLRVSLGQVSPGYGRREGTSMAAPHVAGAAAHVFATHPGISPFQVARILQLTASRGSLGLPRTARDGWGVVNTVVAAGTPAPPDDRAEPNDDVREIGPRATIAPAGRTPVEVPGAWADRNDDPFDVYPVTMRAGERFRVTLTPTSGAGTFRLQAFSPTTVTVSPRVSTPRIGDLARKRRVLARERAARTALLARLRLGSTVVRAPRKGSIVVTARRTGKQLVAVWATAAGGYYSLRIERLSPSRP